MKSKHTRIEHIKLQIAGNSFELTIDQAKELKDILEELFPSRQVSWPTPIIIERDHWYPRPSPWWKYDVICGGRISGQLTSGGDSSGTLCLSLK